MKKTFQIASAVFAVFFLFSATQAQGLKSVGLKGGLNFASIGGSDADDEFKSKTGLAVGGFLTLAVNDAVSLQPEVLYTAKGAKADVVESGQNVTAKINLNYLEIPLLLMVNLGQQEGAVAPMFFAGPSIGFNLSAKAKGEVDEGSAEIDIKDEIKSTEFGVVFGAGVGVPMGNNTLQLAVKYNLGLTSIDDSEDADDVKNRVLSIEAAFGFSTKN